MTGRPSSDALDVTRAPARRDWWTPEQLGERWQVTDEHVRTLIRTGTLRAKNFATGRVPRYRISDSERRRFETTT